MEGRTNELRPWIVVLNIATGQELFSGKGESAAAMNLNPGCCYGKDLCRDVAIHKAHEWRHWFVENGYVAPARQDAEPDVATDQGML